MRRLRLLAGCAFLTTLLIPTTVAAQAAPGSTNFPQQVDLPAGFAPEGISHGLGTTVYVGSLRDGAIWHGDVRTGQGAVLAPGSAGRVSVGVDFDQARGLVWVAGGPTGEVRAYDARDGSLQATYHFDGTSFLNDLAVTSDAVYITDSMVPQLATVPLPPGGGLPDESAATTIPLAGVPYQAGFNLNGIVAARGWLISVQSNTGDLFRIDPRTGAGTLIDTGGASLTNGDGLELLGSTLYVVRNQISQVDIMRLGADLATATLQNSITNDDLDPATDDGLDVPTTATVVAGRLWAVNARFGVTPTPTTAYWITQLPLRP